MAKFTHLHLHSEYSLLDGTIRIKDLIPKLQEHGMNAAALTDHGVMYGSLKFNDAMREAGLKPIIGCEIYVAPSDHTDKSVEDDLRYYHMVLLAQNLTGYRNLMKLVSIGHTEGFYYKPRVDFKTISKYSEGLVALSACLGGVVSKEILRNNPKKAEENARKLAKIFKDRFYIEIQRNGLEEQDPVNEKLLQIAKKLDLPIVATADAHYLNKEDFVTQEVLWCIADGKTLDDPTRRKSGTQECYIKSSEEMEELFADLPEAIENTQKIVDSVEDFDLSFGRIEPIYLDLPEGKTPAQYLRELVLKGAKQKYGELTDQVMERINYELGIIDEKGYNNYFLLVYDFVNFCVKNGIMVGARGSAVGTVVGYCLDIAGVDPIKWELYFERFLNPGRNSPPDIDLDISDERREELIKYAQEKYGESQVKQIITFSKLQTRAAIRDVSRVLGIDLKIADQLSKMVEVVFGKTKDIDYMIENNKEFAEIINSSPQLQEMAGIVRRIAGLARGVSMHACGVVITPDAIDKYVPIQRDSKGTGIGMTQYEMFDLEAVGLLKLDFLGLRNMNIIDTALKKIERHKGEKLNLLNIDTEDEKVYSVLQDGHTVGVFQLESDGMKKTIKMLKPTNPEELCYLLAAYRPGPMELIPEYVAVKNGEKNPKYIVEDLEPILSVTNGVISYQEQVMRIATDVAGYSLSDADTLRKAMGKKKMDVMEAEKPNFIKGGVEKGHEEENMNQIWELLVKFANYGFNKSHAAAYAMISYYTAYLKHYYPMEFMAALLEGDLENFERVIKDLEECDRLGITVLPPSINMSGLYFTVEDEKKKVIRFGMGGIKNVGEDVIRAIVKERERNGLYMNLDDFIYRNIESKVQKRAIEYLIMAGTCDQFGDQSQLLSLLPNLYDRYRKERQMSAEGQFDLFTAPGEEKIHIENPSPLPNVEPCTVHQKLEWEKDLLGLYLTSHPLDDLQEFYQSKNARPISKVLEMDPTRDVIVVGGIATSVRRVTTKKGDNMAFLLIEDKTGQLDLVAFPSVYEELKADLQPNIPMLFAIRINKRDKDKSYVLEKAKTVDQDKFGSNFTGITFKVNGIHSEEDIIELKKYIKSNPGDTQVRIILHDDDGGEKIIKIEQGIISSPMTEKYLEKFS